VGAIIKRGVDIVARFKFYPIAKLWEEMREKTERSRKGEEAKVEQKGKRRRRIALLDD